MLGVSAKLHLESQSEPERPGDSDDRRDRPEFFDRILGPVNRDIGACLYMHNMAAGGITCQCWAGKKSDDHPGHFRSCRQSL